MSCSKNARPADLFEKIEIADSVILGGASTAPLRRYVGETDGVDASRNRVVFDGSRALKHRPKLKIQIARSANNVKLTENLAGGSSCPNSAYLRGSVKASYESKGAKAALSVDRTAGLVIELR